MDLWRKDVMMIEGLVVFRIAIQQVVTELVKLDA